MIKKSNHYLLNPKFQTLNPKQYQMLKIQNTKQIPNPKS